MILFHENLEGNKISLQQTTNRAGKEALSYDDLSIYLIKVGNNWYINSLHKSVLEKVALELGLAIASIIDISGKSRIYGGNIGFLLPTQYSRGGNLKNVLREKLLKNSDLLGILRLSTSKEVAKVDKKAVRVVKN